MKLRGQAGYAMAALLVAMSIMAVMMTVAMPVWKQMVQREKESELIFRGEQYVHAIALFQRKYPGAFPPNLDVLVDQRFLRRKYKDPITNDDFVPVPFGQAPAPTGAAQPDATPDRGGVTGRGGAFGSSPSPTQSAFGSAQGRGGRGTSPIGPPGAATPGGIVGGAGIMGVSSKSKDKSIRIYNGRTHYNEWLFVYAPQVQTPGAGAPGTAVPGPRGQQPGFGPFGGRGPQRGRPGGPGRGRGPGGRGFTPPNSNPPSPFSLPPFGSRGRSGR